MNTTTKPPAKSTGGRKAIVLGAREYSPSVYTAVKHWVSQGMVLEDVAVFLRISTPTLYRKIKADPELLKAVQGGRKEREKTPYRKQDNDYWGRLSTYRRQKSHEKKEQRDALFNSPFNGEDEDSCFDSGWIAYKTNMNILIFVRKGDFNHLLKLVEMDEKYSPRNSWHAGKQGPEQEFNRYPQHGYPKEG